MTKFILISKWLFLDLKFSIKFHFGEKRNYLFFFNLLSKDARNFMVSDLTFD